MRIAVRVDGDPVRPGDAVSGHVEVLEGGAARRMLAALRLLEVTRDHRVPVAEVDLGVIAEGDLRPGEGHAFRGRIPADAVPTHRAANSALIWVVTARVDRRGGDLAEDGEVVVLAAPPGSGGSAPRDGLPAPPAG